MTGWNLPPGCETRHIPGNRPEDVARDEAWEEALAQLRDELCREPSDDEVNERCDALVERDGLYDTLEERDLDRRGE